MTLAYAEAEDLRAMDALRRASQEAVGFVPMSRWEWVTANRAQTMRLLRENGDLVGYIWWTPGLPVAAIQQLVVREDARRYERGTALVDAAIEDMSHPLRYGVTCRCRQDLEAVGFWAALGFEPVRLEESGKRGPVVRFYKSLQPALLDLGSYLPVRGITAGGQRQGFRRLAGRTPRADTIMGVPET